MKSRFFVLLLFGLVLVAGWYLQRPSPRAWPAFNRRMTAEPLAEPPPGQMTSSPVVLPTTESLAPLAVTLTNATLQDSNGTAATGLPPELTPQAALEHLRITLRLYTSMLGQNPVGLNFEITRALNGYNAKHVHFIRPEAGMRLNARGELVDLWGTPYFFHQLSSTQMEIRSAGPDRVMWTADDLMVR